MAKAKSADTQALEDELSSVLGMLVSIDDEGGHGRLSVSYASLDQLDELLHRLTHNPGRLPLSG